MAPRMEDLALRGYLVVPRVLFDRDSGFFRDLKELGRFVDLLALARFKRDRNGIARGSCQVSCRFLGKRWDMHHGSVSKLLSKWEKALLIKRNADRLVNRAEKIPQVITFTLYDAWMCLPESLPETHSGAEPRGEAGDSETLLATHPPERPDTDNHLQRFDATLVATRGSRTTQGDSQQPETLTATHVGNKEKYELIGEGGDEPTRGDGLAEAFVDFDLVPQGVEIGDARAFQIDLVCDLAKRIDIHALRSVEREIRAGLTSQRAYELASDLATRLRLQKRS